MGLLTRIYWLLSFLLILIIAYQFVKLSLEFFEEGWHDRYRIWPQKTRHERCRQLEFAWRIKICRISEISTTFKHRARSHIFITYLVSRPREAASQICKRNQETNRVMLHLLNGDSGMQLIATCIPSFLGCIDYRHTCAITSARRLKTARQLIEQDGKASLSHPWL